MGLAITAFAVFIGLLIAGLWVPLAITVSALFYIYFEGGFFGLRAVGLISWGSMYSFTLTAVPLFLFMAELLLQSGVAARVYDGLSRIVQRMPGGLLQTNIAGCALFSAISGSSVATAAAIGTVAMPQLLGRGYSRTLSAGSLAAGGSLGILIPPSIPLIIYGTFTETSVTRLFFAGFVPGILMAVIFMIFIMACAWWDPKIAPAADHSAEPGERVSWLRTAADILPFMLVIVVTLGSLYFGFATPTEAAAVGCGLAIIVGLFWGDLRPAVFFGALRNAMVTSAAILFIVYAAFLFSYAVGIDGLGHRLTQMLVALDLSRPALILAIVAVYLILGCVVESIGMMVITLPVLFPVLVAYEIDLIWFGIFLVILIELGQLTPPLGINLFVIQGIWSGQLSEVIRGSTPFFFLIFGMMLLLWAIPDIATWLPRFMSD